MAAYLVLFFAVLSRVLPHFFSTVALHFSGVGGGLLYFGARRSRGQAAIAVLVLMATDYYLTVFAYGYAWHTSAYLVTWLWYAGICLAQHPLAVASRVHIRRIEEIDPRIQRLAEERLTLLLVQAPRIAATRC
jgi:hypothetical protein